MLPLTRQVSRIIFGAVECHPALNREQVENSERSKGKRGIGWHWLIFADGHVEPGRDLEKNGNHTTGHNLDSIGVGIVGGLLANVPKNHYGSGQAEAAVNWVREYAIKVNLPVFPQCDVVHTRNPYFPCTFHDLPTSRTLP